MDEISEQLNVMTKEQIKLIEDNHNLIYYWMRKYHVTENGIEDWYGAAAIGLVNAALIYDKNTNVKFRTLASNCIKNEYNRILHKYTYQKRSGEEVHFDFQDEDKYANYLNRSDNHINYLELQNVIQTVLCTCNEKTQCYIKERLSGKKFIEIAEEYKVSKQAVHQAYNNFLKKIKSII